MPEDGVGRGEHLRVVAGADEELCAARVGFAFIRHRHVASGVGACNWEGLPSSGLVRPGASTRQK